MDPTERFTELLRRREHDVPLDESALLIAAHDHAVDIGAELAQLDALAHGAPTRADELARHLFVELGFTGNAADYGDPGNSYLDQVVHRRVGIPISLSVLMIEVGRRVGTPLVGVGMPGHFLVRAAPGEFFDPFAGGAALDAAGCRDVFERLQPRAAFDPAFLDPVGPRAIVARMLANLVRGFIQRDARGAVWALRLRLRVPGLLPDERRDAAALLGSLGCFDEAAAELDTVAETLDGDAAARAERDAAALRARAN